MKRFLLFLSLSLTSFSACSSQVSPSSNHDPDIERQRDSAQDADPDAQVPQNTHVDVTEKVKVFCSSTGRLPMRLADIDRDGNAELVSTKRTSEGIELTIHSAETLEAERMFKVSSDTLEVGVTSRPDGSNGDLWVHTGRVVDKAKNAWSFELKRLEGKTLKTVWTGGSSSDPNLAFDFDGDGHVDPIVSPNQVYLKGELKTIPLHAHTSSFHGIQRGFDRQDPVDLDGDGDRDVVVDALDGFHILEVPSLHSVWHQKSESGTLSGVIRWKTAPGGYVIHTNEPLIRKVQLFAADSGHSLLATFTRDDEYTRILPWADPFGDGSALVLGRPERTDLLKTPGGNPIKLDGELIQSGDPAIPQSLSGRFAGGDGSEAIVVRVLSFGSPAFGGRESGRYEIRALEPPGKGSGRLIREGEVPGSGSPGVSILDLDGDGELEILLDEHGSYMTCNGEGGGNTSRWILIRGDGTVLFEDEMRHADFGKNGSRRDATAKVRLVDFGNKRRGLRFRTPTEEFWVFSPGQRPKNLPVCIE